MFSRYRFRLILGVLFLAPFSLSAAEWALVWSDEFDYTGLPDASKWDYEEGFVRNRERQFYTRARRENARVENGLLIIEARKERFPNPRYTRAATPGNWKTAREFAEYTSASVITRGRADWLYGRVEVRAQLPAGKGVWPAIWMLGTNIVQVGWPACGEIDIMENVGFMPDKIFGTVHTRKYNHVDGTAKGSSLVVPQPDESFHVYGIEWDEKKIDFFVDDRVYFTFRNQESGNEAWPFDKNQYLLLNLAVGGSWGGRQGIDPEIFPQRYSIDYVRVYRRKASQDEIRD
jgi:beta-glucanase (GH16 family)